MARLLASDQRRASSKRRNLPQLKWEIGLVNVVLAGAIVVATYLLFRSSEREGGERADGADVPIEGDEGKPEGDRSVEEVDERLEADAEEESPEPGEMMVDEDVAEEILDEEEGEEEDGS